jgi:hypothetical protein
MILRGAMLPVISTTTATSCGHGDTVRLASILENYGARDAVMEIIADINETYKKIRRVVQTKSRKRRWIKT